MKRISLIALLAALVSCSTNADRPAPPAPVAPDADAARAAVQHTFGRARQHDARCQLPRWGADSTGTWRTVNLSGSAFTSRLGQPGPAYLERTWEADVRVNGDVAVFSAPYDFWVEQTCSHCGYDAITLVRSGAVESDFRGWRIASLTYTVDASGEEACRERFAGMPASPFPAE